MDIVFYIASAVAIICTVMVITRLNVVHALLYMIVALLSVALVFYTLGAPFVAALEVIIYAGAIMVLFVFVIMILNLGPQTSQQERLWLDGRIWVGPTILALILIAEVAYVLSTHSTPAYTITEISPRQVSTQMFGPYILGVELSSFLLLSAVVGAFHLGRRRQLYPEEIAVSAAAVEQNTSPQGDIQPEPQIQSDIHR